MAEPDVAGGAAEDVAASGELAGGDASELVVASELEELDTGAAALEEGVEEDAAAADETGPEVPPTGPPDGVTLLDVPSAAF